MVGVVVLVTAFGHESRYGNAGLYGRGHLAFVEGSLPSSLPLFTEHARNGALECSCAHLDKSRIIRGQIDCRPTRFLWRY